ncbi:hypothetical protein E6C27_scaffold67G003420 [Cucumis melo var. makuwa]|uniref:Uncharacterized protein n=1 Tax=Cucumis melo var. makuwa TaxID=1194695 RepID=A0A5A7TIV0_CUCMM|nr:hypothetical protein E6C27_scaffold67G003420 [Cucumis melo var. makuwa]
MEVIPSSAIEHLLGDDRAFAVRSTVPVGAIRHLRRLERSDRAPSSFEEMTLSSAIQLLLGNDRTFAVRSTALVEAIEHLHCLERSNQAPSSFREVTPPSVIQLLMRDDQPFAVRSTALVHCFGRSDQTPSSFGEVTSSSAIQLLLGDDRAFSVRFTVLIHHPGRSDWTPSSFGEVTLPSAIQLLLGDDRAFSVRSIALVGAIGHLRRLKRELPSIIGHDSVRNIVSIDDVGTNKVRQGQPDQVPKLRTAKKPQLDVEANNSLFFSTEIEALIPINFLHRRLHALPLELLSTLPFQDIEGKALQENDDIRFLCNK